LPFAKKVTMEVGAGTAHDKGLDRFAGPEKARQTDSVI
jgi:hypothetical protein